MVSPPRFALSILALSEDGSTDAPAVIETLVRKMLLLVDGGCRTNRVDFEPATPEARRAVKGARWKERSTAGEETRRSLRRSIATKLGEGDGFVVFHVDADKTWSSPGASENVEAFRRELLPGIRALLTARFPAEFVDRAMSRLFIFAPHWEIEAWLYQNTAAAIDICQRRYEEHHAEPFRRWAQDRALLDEEPDPKDKTRFEDAHNLALAGAGFPAEELFYVGKSFTAAVNAMLECADLVDALARTQAWA